MSATGPNFIHSQVIDPRFERNYGFWSEAEQEAILDAHAAVAGAGGDGFQLTLELAMMGVSRFSIADPEVFERENMNRVPGAREDTVGRNKAEVLREEILKINPDADVSVFTEGITEENIDEFLKDATISFDETELTHLELGTMLARAARRKGITNVLVMNVGFAAQVTAFRPDSGQTFEQFMGIPEDMPLDEVGRQRLKLSRCIPYLPGYVELSTLEAVKEGAPLPSIAQGVNQAVALGGSQAFLHITSGVNPRRPKPIVAPEIGWVDSLTLESGRTRHVRLRHALGVGNLIFRNIFRRNGKAGSYTAEERQRRQEARQAAVEA